MNIRTSGTVAPVDAAHVSHMPAPPERRLLTEREAAVFLGVSVASLRLARCEGHRGNRMPPPPHLKLGRSVRYDIYEINAYVEKLKQQRDTDHALRQVPRENQGTERRDDFNSRDRAGRGRGSRGTNG